VQGGVRTPRRTRFWQHVGLLAAVVAAALASALPSAAEAATSASAGDGGTAAVAAAYNLLGYLPPAVQNTCSLGRPSDDPPIEAVARHITAELYCYPQDGLNVTFVHLSSAAALNQLYTSYARPNFRPQLFDPAASCESQGTWSSNGVNAGREVCYRRGTSTANPPVTIAWTYDRANIFAIAYRQDANADSLRSWWDGAGPRPFSTPGFELPTPGENATANPALLQRFPSQVRSSGHCTNVNLASQAALGDLYDWRFWLVGSVDCMPHGLPVADVTYNQWTDSTALAAYLRSVTAGARPNAPTPTDQASGCTSGPYNQQGQVAGAFVCTSARGDTTNHTKNLIGVVYWSNSQLKIGAFAARNDNNTAALMQWWRSNASGPLLSGTAPSTPTPTPTSTSSPTPTTPGTAADSPKGSTCPPICY
jgi:hypothetical protein